MKSVKLSSSKNKKQCVKIFENACDIINYRLFVDFSLYPKFQLQRHKAEEDARHEQARLEHEELQRRIKEQQKEKFLLEQQRLKEEQRKKVLVF